MKRKKGRVLLTMTVGEGGRGRAFLIEEDGLKILISPYLTVTNGHVTRM